MRFNIGQTLWYVDKFVFTIHPVVIMDYDDNEEPFMYIEESGGYLAENNLFETVEEAQQEALLLLEEFYINKRLDINSFKGEENV
jgi:hypothetical protein